MVQNVFTGVVVDKKQDYFLHDGVVPQVSRRQISLMGIAVGYQAAVFDELVVMDRKRAEPQIYQIWDDNLRYGQIEDDRRRQTDRSVNHNP